MHVCGRVCVCVHACACMCVYMNVLTYVCMSGCSSPPVLGTMVGLKPSDVPPPLAVKMISAGAAACVGDLITFPLDTAKVRLQVLDQGTPPPHLITHSRIP